MKLFIVTYGMPPGRGERQARVRQYAVVGESVEDAVAKAQTHVEWVGVGKWSAKESEAGVFMFNVYLSDRDFK